MTRLPILVYFDVLRRSSLRNLFGARVTQTDMDASDAGRIVKHFRELSVGSGERAALPVEPGASSIGQVLW